MRTGSPSATGPLTASTSDSEGVRDAGVELAWDSHGVSVSMKYAVIEKKRHLARSAG